MPKREYKIPRLDKAVAEETVNGEYKINTPTEVHSKLNLSSEDPKSVVRLNCNSLITYSPDTIVKCNSCVGTILYGGTGDQTEIIECGKCRTSYLVRTRFDDEGVPHISCAIWDISRNVKNYCFATSNDKGDFIVRFNDGNRSRLSRVK